MALPAGRYGVTKNQLLKIKKLPMNTIKLIEELTEKFDLLGTAAFKNSTSVVTDSSDLVESGAVYDAIKGNGTLLKDTVGWVGKNKYPIKVGNDSVDDNSGGTHSEDNGSLVVNCTPNNASGIYFASNSQVREIINSGVDCDAIFTIQSTVNTTAVIGNYTEIVVTTTPKRVRLHFTGTSNVFVIYGTGASAIFTISDFMICDPDIIDNTYEPYHASVEDTLRDAEVVHGKNLLPFDIVSITENGTLKFTLQDDNTVKANGTSTGSASRLEFFYGTGTKLKQILGDGNSFVLSGCPTNGSPTTYFMRVNKNDPWTDLGTDIGNGASFSKSSIEDNSNYRVSIIIDTGATVNNIIFKPMICTLEEWNKSHDYEPYYVPLKDVVPNKCDNSVIGTVEDGTNPTKSYAVGEFMVRDGAFCQVTVPVTTSSTWTEGSNYTKKSIAEVLQSLMS